MGKTRTLGVICIVFGSIFSLVFLIYFISLLGSGATFGDALVLLLSYAIPAVFYFFLAAVFYEISSSYDDLNYKIKKLEGKEEQEKKNARFCRTCHKQIPFDSNVCPYCGDKVERY